MNGRTWGAMASTIFGLLAALFSLDLEGRPHAATITAIGTPALSTAETQDDLGRLVNPHSDLIFRVTDATSCRDCHAPVKGSPERLAVLDNGAVRGLIAKGKGAHGPGRFADCFRCHSGGRKGVEKYSDH